jgi:hypothetical protein
MYWVTWRAIFARPYLLHPRRLATDRPRVLGPDIHGSPRHRMPLDLRHEGSTCVPMTRAWQVLFATS